MKKKALIPFLLFCLLMSLSLVIPTGTAVASPNSGAGEDDPPRKRGGSSEVRKRDRVKRSKDKPRKRHSRRNKKDEDKNDEFPRGDHEKQFREGLGEEYRVVYTPHFAVFTNAEEMLVKSFIHRMEVTFNSVYKLCDRTGVKMKRPEEKLIVIYNATWSDYNEACITFTGHGVPPSAAGVYFHHPYNFATFYDISTMDYLAGLLRQAEQLKKEARNTRNRDAARAMSRQARYIQNKIDDYKTKTNKEVVQHELAHQCLFNFGFHTLEARNPIWLAEGMSTQFEVPPGKSGAGLGALNQERLGMLREIVKHNPPNLKAFIRQMENTPNFDLPGYAVSWGLLNYLLKHRKKEFPGFVAAVAERSEEESRIPGCDVELFEKHFGPLDEKFQKRWERFIMNLPYRNPFRR